MTKPPSLYTQLRPITIDCAALLLGNNNPGAVWNNLMRDIPASPQFDRSFTIGDVVRYILAYQTAYFAAEKMGGSDV